MPKPVRDRPTSPLYCFRTLPEGSPARVRVDAGDLADPVSPRLFGNFLEHLGFAIDGGLWAQLLANPTFHRESNLTPSQRAELLDSGAYLSALASGGHGRHVSPPGTHWLPGTGATGFGVAALDDASSLGIPFPWAPLEGWEPAGAPSSKDGGASRPPVRCTVGRLGYGVRLQASRNHPRPAGVRQGLFLPLHRTRRYEGRLWARTAPESVAEGASPSIRVGLRRRPDAGGETVCSVVAGSPGVGWTELRFALEVPEDTPPRRAGSLPVPLDFFVAAEGRGDVMLDRVELFPADHVDGFDPEVVDLVRSWPVPVLRWPGGNYASEYHWRDGIGPRHLRPTRPNLAWGGLDYHHVGTDEFIALCRRVGAEPQITVNTGTGSPEEAAAWVEYCNGAPDTPMGRLRAAGGHPEPYGVKLWEIGNEIYGSWQHGFCSGEENARRFGEWARAMRAVDPTIELLACGNAFDFVSPGPQWDFTAADGGGWHEALLADGPAPDAIALHALPDNNRGLEYLTDEQAHYALMSQPAAWERVHLPALESAAERLVGRPVPVAITEWGILGPNDHRARTENYGEAVYAGLFLHMALRLGQWVKLANTTALLHGGCIRKAGGRVFLDAQYYVLQRYALLAGARPAACELEAEAYDVGPGRPIPMHADVGAPLENVPIVDVAALVEGDAAEPGRPPSGRLVICLVNVHLRRAIPVEVEAVHFRLAGDPHAVTTAPATPAPVADTLAPEPLPHPVDVAAVSSPLEPERFRPRPLPVERATRPEPLAGDGSGLRFGVVLPPASVTWIYLPGQAVSA